MTLPAVAVAPVLAPKFNFTLLALPIDMLAADRRLISAYFAAYVRGEYADYIDAGTALFDRRNHATSAGLPFFAQS